MTRSLLSLVLVAVLAVAANAAITLPGDVVPGVNLVWVDNSSVATLADYTTYDLVVMTGADWTNAAFELVAEQGTIFQHAFGDPSGRGPGLAALIAAAPDLEFDTYVTSPTVGSGVSTINPALWGIGAVKFDTAGLAISWYDSDPSGTSGRKQIARLTVSNDFVGTWRAAVFDGDSNGVETNFSGIIPEPATLSLLGLGGLALIRRRR